MANTVETTKPVDYLRTVVSQFPKNPNDPIQFLVAWLIITTIAVLLAQVRPKAGVLMAFVVLLGTATVLVMRKDINA